MSNNHLVNYLVQEKGISIEEAQKVCEKRKKCRRYFKEVKESENHREEWSKNETEREI